MSQNSSIEWTDHTFNVAWGCTKVSEGCRNCYAERDSNRWSQHGVEWGVGGKRRTFGEKHWNAPFRWNRAAEKAGVPARVFCSSMCDVFEDHPVVEAQLDRLFATMALTPWLRWQVLTKRPARMHAYVSDPATEERTARASALIVPNAALSSKGIEPDLQREAMAGWATWPLPNVWLGVSVEDQATTDERIPLLLSTPAALRFVSYEPALGPVDFERIAVRALANPHPADPTHASALFDHDGFTERLDWIIVGGESGPGARPFDVEWARSTVRQCREAGVPVFVKQLGARPLAMGTRSDADWEFWESIGVEPKHWIDCWEPRLHDRKGGDMSEWPEDLRVREMPAVTS